MSDFEYDNLTKQRKTYVDAIVEHGEQIGLDLNKTTFCRAELRRVSMNLKGKKWIPNWITHDHARRAGVGVFHLPEVQEAWASKNGVELKEETPKIDPEHDLHEYMEPEYEEVAW